MLPIHTRNLINYKFMTLFVEVPMNVESLLHKGTECQYASMGQMKQKIMIRKRTLLGKQ